MGYIKILLVFSTVVITLLTALLLNFAAKDITTFNIFSIIIIILVIAINFTKFKVWGIIYKKYHLSESYPLTALFFPSIYLVAIYNGEARFELTKSVGVIMILVGIWVMNSKKVRI